jgi:hypothetical protein
MKSIHNAWAVLGLSIVLLAFTTGDSVGQPPKYGPSDSAEWMRETGFQFSLSRREDVSRLVKVRNMAMLEATLALEKLARKEYTRDDDEPHYAAKVLVAIGGGDSRALAALCDNILTLRGIDDEGGSPLRDFKAAQALVHIGGSRVRRAIFDSLRQPLDRRALLIRAHVLAELDPPHIMCEHIKLAIAAQEELHRVMVFRDHDEQYLSNLRQLHDWLKSPEFLEDRKNWP